MNVIHLLVYGHKVLKGVFQIQNAGFPIFSKLAERRFFLFTVCPALFGKLIKGEEQPHVRLFNSDIFDE